MTRLWLHSVTPIAPPRSSNPRLGTLLYAALVTGSWAGILSLAIYGLGRLLGVPFAVVLRQGEATVQVPWYFPLLVPVLAALLAGMATVLVLGRRHARAMVLWAGALLALASLVLPAMQPSSVLWSTRIWLLVMHVVAWFLIVPQLARIAGDSEPSASEVRELVSQTQQPR
ncbi:MAG: DUF6069 family protein [Actinomycetota bacterium]|nr:DUF6069 family protein [Actinomycetota bacterium]MDP2288576.1 DUF6069 family protein [Actinomycetota bacterium]